MKNMSIHKCLDKIFENLQPGTEFYGNWIHDRVADLNDKYRYAYPDTILRQVRKYYRDQIICVNPSKSLYKFTGLNA